MMRSAAVEEQQQKKAVQALISRVGVIFVLLFSRLRAAFAAL